MDHDPLATEHWRTCLIPRRLRAPESEGAAAFFVTTYARDLTFAGFLSEEQARPVVRAYASGVGADDGVADAELAAALQARRSETAEGPGDEVGFAAAVEHLRRAGVAVRVGIDCCRDVGLERVEREHAPGDRTFAVVGIDDLMKVGRAARIDVSFSYLDAALADVLTPALHARASAGDVEARTTWWRTVDEAEIQAGGAVALAMREVGGLEVDWDGTARDTVHVAVPGWRRPLPA